MMTRHHAVITGTGRTGTTFLIQLLTGLGLDTGFTPGRMQLIKNARAGLELDVRSATAPYIVKSPWFCDHAEEVLSRDDILIDHVFLPVRDLYAAAESRRYVVEAANQKNLKPSQISGGLWHTNEASEQETVLLGQVYKLLLALATTEIPITLMNYPRITRDPEYLYRKLAPLAGEVEYGAFKNVFDATVRPDWVHSFGENDS